jgi:hypothetical protein
MAPTPFTLIDDRRVIETEASTDGTIVHLSPEALQTALGWQLKPEGLCRGEVCIPLGHHPAVATAAGVDLAAFADAIGRPLALDVDERAAALGVSAVERGRRMTSLEAPDFTLPDLTGRLHSLSDHRGRKVLLVAYASW